MVRVESTYWPIVAVGAVPDFHAEQDEGMDDRALWSSGDLRLAVVIAGDHARAWRAQEEIFTWLSERRDCLSSSVSRVAWIFEDEAMRRSADRWLALLGDGLFRAEVMTFCSVRLAVSWLAFDPPLDSWSGMLPDMAHASTGERLTGH